MGAVFRCADAALDDQVVAVKLLPPEHTASEVARGRVKQEVVSARSLRHPNIVGVYEYFEGGGRVGFSMEFVAGHTLERHLAGRVEGSPLGDAVGAERIASVSWVVGQLAAALDHMHARGLIHRDVKPSNVMLAPAGDGFEVKLLDLGIVHAMGGTGLTRDLQPGTVEYMAPELLSGRGDPSVAADVYSLGKLLYFALTGERPEFGYEPAPPSSLVDGLPPELDGPLLACFGRPAERPASAGELAATLAGVAEEYNKGREVDRLRASEDAAKRRAAAHFARRREEQEAAKPRSAARSLAVLIAIVALGMVAAVAVVGIRVLMGRNGAPDEIAESPPEEEGDSSRSNPADIDWVPIPGGTFAMGSDDGIGDEAPAHDVTVPAFEMARTEVTVAQYRRCLDADVCTEEPGTGDDCNWGKSGRDDHPVNCVTWKQAQRFAEYAGGRLPSESEWEYAARSGGRGIAYPWGDQEASCSFAVMSDGGNGCGERTTWPVCSKAKGHSDQGLCDMAGNVSEWVEDCIYIGYAGAPTDGSPRTTCDPSTRVMRGGSWGDNSQTLQVDRRLWWRWHLHLDSLGFRLARDVP